MEYIKLENNNYKKEDLEKALEVIKNGGVVILPTDTVYGIAADALNEEAVARIYSLKNRKFSNPCNILVSDIDMIRKVTKGISSKEEKIINEFFPGALTIIFEKNEVIPNIVTANLDTIGVRMPKNKFLLDLIKTFRKTYCCNKLELSRRRKYDESR